MSIDRPIYCENIKTYSCGEHNSEAPVSGYDWLAPGAAKVALPSAMVGQQVTGGTDAQLDICGGKSILALKYNFNSFWLFFIIIEYCIALCY